MSEHKPPRESTQEPKSAADHEPDVETGLQKEVTAELSDMDPPVRESILQTSDATEASRRGEMAAEREFFYPGKRQNGAVVILVAVLLLLLASAGGGLIYVLRQRASANALYHGQIAALRNQIETLEHQIAGLGAGPSVRQAATTAATRMKTPEVGLAQLATRLDRQEKELASLSATVAADHTAFSKMAANVGDFPELATKARRMAKIQAAMLALQTGAPLGELTNAPEALGRYAEKAPPTEAVLRAQFQSYASKALAVGGNIGTDRRGTLWERVRANIIGLVTVRRGNKIVVGDRAEAIISDARADLAEGNLSGAVQTLEGLPKNAQEVMQPWVTQAENLLAARAALLKLAEQQ